jgi:hypothetical protein
VLAWYHGDRGQQRITTPEFAILTLLLLLGAGAFWYYQGASETAAVAVLPSTSAATATDHSIAVLPFVNMSPDKEQEYFADGIAEELLNLLSQVPELRVIARTSSFSFKGKDVDIAEIARTLNVANVSPTGQSPARPLTRTFPECSGTSRCTNDSRCCISGLPRDAHPSLLPSRDMGRSPASLEAALLGNAGLLDSPPSV